MSGFEVTYKDEPLHGWRKATATAFMLCVMMAMIVVLAVSFVLVGLLTPVAAVWWLIAGSWPKWHARVVWR